MVFLHWCAGIIMVYHGILFLQCAENHEKETVAQVFSCDFYEISKNTFFIEQL